MAELSSLLVCRKCGSHRVQCLDWIDANLDILLGHAEIVSDSDTYCEECEDCAGIEVKQVEPEEMETLLLKRRQELQLQATR